MRRRLSAAWAAVQRHAAAARRRWPVVDHAFLAWARADEVLWSRQAASITYYGFLSLFPLLALAFAVLGYVTRVWPDAEQGVLEAVEGYLPGLVGDGPNQFDLTVVQDAAGRTTVFGVLALLWTGTNLVDALRDAMWDTFARSKSRYMLPVNKLRSLGMLLAVGTLLLVSVATSSLATTATNLVLGWIDLDGSTPAAVLLRLLAVLSSLLLDTAVLLLVFTVMSGDRAGWRDVLGGAVLGAVAIEVLKLLATEIIGAVRGNPGFAVFAVALALLLWINLTSRAVLLAAAWAATSKGTRRRAGPAAER